MCLVRSCGFGAQGVMTDGYRSDESSQLKKDFSTFIWLHCGIFSVRLRTNLCECARVRFCNSLLPGGR